MSETEQAVYDVIYPLRRPAGQSIDAYCRHAAHLVAERLASPSRDAASADLRDADRLGKEFDWTAEERDAVLGLMAAARSNERQRMSR